MKNLFKNVLIMMSIAGMLVTGLFISNDMVLAASGDATVYITKTGECYHADGCSSLRKSKIATTLQSAVDKGYRACSKCHPGSLDATSNDNTTNTTTVSKSSATTNSTASASAEVEALKNYKGNNSDFNAYSYYVNNVDLQTAIGADGDKLLKHYNEYGKAEGRKAK